jgi:hypothetical protein
LELLELLELLNVTLPNIISINFVVDVFAGVHVEAGVKERTVAQ